MKTIVCCGLLITALLSLNSCQKNENGASPDTHCQFYVVGDERYDRYAYVGAVGIRRCVQHVGSG